MSAGLWRRVALGGVGLVVVAGLCGCQCNGGGPRRTASRGGKQPVVDNTDLVLERLDRIQMDFDSRMNNVERNISDINSRPVSQPMVEYVSQPAPVVDVLPPAPIEIAPAVYSLPTTSPVVSPSSKAADRAALSAKHLRVPGVTVADLQRALSAAGFNPGKIDGAMGKNTINAITQFQSTYGLKADGICGKQTWAYLQNVTSAAVGTGPHPK